MKKTLIAALVLATACMASAQQAPSAQNQYSSNSMQLHRVVRLSDGRVVARIFKLANGKFLAKIYIQSADPELIYRLLRGETNFNTPPEISQGKPSG